MSSRLTSCRDQDDGQILLLHLLSLLALRYLLLPAHGRVWSRAKEAV